MNYSDALTRALWNECRRGTIRSAAVIYSLLIASLSEHEKDAWETINNGAMQALGILKATLPGRKRVLLNKIKEEAWEIHRQIPNEPIDWS